jgi:protoporphyrinogen/coproporphyrinogen III oxidase
VPTKLKPFVLSPLISPLGKLRMGLDLVLPAKRDGEDETLATFITRRLGAEALDKIAEPLMSGIYNAEADKQSLLATFPRFRAIEEKHGSLIRGMLAARQARSAPSVNGQTPKPPSLFISFKKGMETLVTALRQELHGDLRLNTAVEGLEAGEKGGYRLSLGDGSALQADAVILAVPAYVGGAATATAGPGRRPQARGDSLREHGDNQPRLSRRGDWRPVAGSRSGRAGKRGTPRQRRHDFQ